jgi:site-specific DNA-methyltransferase (adenine-specific)
MIDYNIYQGSASDVLAKELTNRVINCVITSPPYFKKRKYGSSEKEIGQQGTADSFVKSLADIFDAVNLHPMGSVWVNLGDKRDTDGSLMMVPERFAIEMKSRNWKLADNVVWAKIIDDEDGTTEGGCMIEPAARRLNGNGYESLFRFTKTPKASEAWVDTSAVRIPRSGMENDRYLPAAHMRVETSTTGRNLHNVWRFKMGQTSKKHFAVFPEELVERPVAMTCPLEVCSKCGFLRERIIEMVEYDEKRGSKRAFGKYNSIENAEDVESSGRMDSGKVYVPKYPRTTGWTKCDCNAEFCGGTVLDPFCGSGTVGAVALRMGRNFIGIELYDEFKAIAEKRCSDVEEYFQEHNISVPHLAR